MKKHYLVFITIAIALLVSTVSFASSDVKLFVNGKKANTEVMVVNGTSYVPLREVANLLGADVNWDGPTSTITISSQGNITSEPKNDKTEAEKKETITYLRSLKVESDFITLDARILNLMVEIEIHKLGVESEDQFKKQVEKTMFPSTASLTLEGKTFQSIAAMVLNDMIGDDKALAQLQALIDSRR
jgi:hypothetical protein